MRKSARQLRRRFHSGVLVWNSTGTVTRKRVAREAIPLRHAAAKAAEAVTSSSANRAIS
jgi:hypothetical protein